MTASVSGLLQKYAGSPRRGQLWWATKGKKDVMVLMEKVEASKSTLSLIVGVQSRYERSSQGRKLPDRVADTQLFNPVPI